MRRRHYLTGLGIAVTTIAGCGEADDPDAEAEADPPTDTDMPTDTPATEGEDTETPTETEPETGTPEVPDAPDPQSFDGEGSVVEEVTIDGGMTVIEATHDGERNFIVELTGGPGNDRLLVNEIGATKTVGGEGVEGGEWMLDVTADGAWQLTVRQPRIAEGGGDDLPVEYSGDATGAVHAVNLEGTAVATASHDGEGNFIVESYARDGEMHLDTLVFNEMGQLDGAETTVEYEGTSWITVMADGAWTLALE